LQYIFFTANIKRTFPARLSAKFANKDLIADVYLKIFFHIFSIIFQIFFIKEYTTLFNFNATPTEKIWMVKFWFFTCREHKVGCYSWKKDI